MVAPFTHNRATVFNYTCKSMEWLGTLSSGKETKQSMDPMITVDIEIYFSSNVSMKSIK